MIVAELSCIHTMTDSVCPTVLAHALPVKFTGSAIVQLFGTTGHIFAVSLGPFLVEI